MKDFELSGCEMLTYEMLEQKVQYWSIDGFDIITAPISHNVPCWCIIIKCKEENVTFCYSTDFNAIPKIEGVTHWLYEVNYIEAYIDEMIEQDKDLHHTGFNFHHSLEDAVDYFTNLKTRPKEIVCCHLSASHSIKQKILQAMKPFADVVRIAGEN